MFMRYRGGGIGHKYMRAIEEIYENMSRERTHHKERKRAPPDKDAMDVDNESASDNGREPEAFTQPQADQHAGPSKPTGTSDGHGVSGGGEGSSADKSEGEEEGEGEDDDEEYAPGSDSDSSEVDDSDDVASDGGRQDESYGFGDL
jgi:hypothetical protein